MVLVTDQPSPIILKLVRVPPTESSPLARKDLPKAAWTEPCHPLPAKQMSEPLPSFWMIKAGSRSADIISLAPVSKLSSQKSFF